MNVEIDVICVASLQNSKTYLPEPFINTQHFEQSLFLFGKCHLYPARELLLVENGILKSTVVIFAYSACLIFGTTGRYQQRLQLFAFTSEICISHSMILTYIRLSDNKRVGKNIKRISKFFFE